MADTRRGYVLIGVLAALTLAGALSATFAVASRRATQSLRAEVDRARAQVAARGGAVQAAKMVAVSMGVSESFDIKGARRTPNGAVEIGGLPAFPPEMVNAGGLLGEIAKKLRTIEQQRAKQEGRSLDERSDAGDKEVDITEGGAGQAVKALPPALALEPMTITLSGTPVHIALECEMGKLDINTTPRHTLRRLLMALGDSEADAEAMLDAIEAHKISRTDVNSADRRVSAVGFRDRPLRGARLDRLESLVSVPGVTPDAYERLVPHLTVNGEHTVDPNYASRATLRAIGIDDDRAIDRVEAARKRMPRLDREAMLNAVGASVMALIEERIAFDMEPVFTIRAAATSGSAQGRHMVRLAPGGKDETPRILESREGWL